MLDQAPERMTFERALDWLTKGTAILMIAYHMLATWRPFFNDLMHQNIHLGFAVLISLLFGMRSAAGGKRILFAVAILLGLFCTVYMHVNFERLDMFSGYPELHDIPVGILLPLLVLVISWMQWGAIFTCLALVAILYALFGHLIPGILGHAEMRPLYVLSLTGVGYRGIYGVLLNASAIIIMPFIIFGSAFESVGINRVFIQIGNWIGNRLRGGSAQIAVFTSSLVSMCTGAAMANVALTGAYTIPLMKKSGYKPEQAGAIEAVASAGGQITPPIMGVAVFIMANFLGISYNVLMVKAIPPAVIYFILCAVSVVLIAKRDNIPKIFVAVDTSLIVRGIWVFVVPMTLVVYLLINRFSPAYAAYIALAGLFLVSVLQRETRPTLGQVINGLTHGAHVVASIAIVLAAVGIFIRMLMATGLGIKIVGVIETISGGNVFVALVFTMVLCILMGCTLPTVPAYAIVALVIAPVLVNMGVERLLAHFFVFYFAVLAVVTPPLAPGSMVAAKLAGADFWKTAWEGTKLALPFFLVPYFIIHNPLLLLEPQKEPLEIVFAVIGIAIACVSALVAIQRFFLTHISFGERILFFLVAVAATSFGVGGNYGFFGFAVVVFSALLINQVGKRRKVHQ